MMLVIGRDWLNGGAVRYGGEFAGEGCLRCIAMRPDVEKATFTEEELQRQKKNASVCMDGAYEYANNIKIIS